MRAALRFYLRLFVATLALLVLGEVAVSWWRGDSPWWSPLGSSALGLFCALWGFFGGVAFLRAVLGLGGACLSVARVVIDEAMRRRIALASTVLLLIVIVGLPWVIDSHQRVDYRVQSFLSYSLGLTALLLTVSTLFLSCGTLSGELEDRRIHSVLVKPIYRGVYLAGKLLGVLLLNGLILGIAGFVIFAEARAMTSKTDDTRDLRRVYAEVLTARRGVPAQPEPDAFRREVASEVERRRSQRPEAFDGVEEERQSHAEILKRWFYIEPGDERTFVFRGLHAALPRSEQAVLRMKARMPFRAQEHSVKLLLHLNGERHDAFASPKEIKLIPLRKETLEEDRLTLTVKNVIPETEDVPRTSVHFWSSDGLEVLFPMGTFAGNLVRGLAMLWIKVGFVAALGLGASTFVGFPVACLLVIVLTTTAAMSSYLIDTAPRSTHSHSDHDAEGGGPPILRHLRGAGLTLAGVLERYSRYTVATRIVDGRVVPWAEVGSCLLWIGGVWGGGVSLVGLLVFRRRELARVQV